MSGAEADLVLRARRAWVDGAFRPAAVVVRNGVVDAVLPFGDAVDAAEDRTVPTSTCCSPGLVDTHVHVNEPGRTEWEGFASATRAAALGGVTTIVDMPLNSIPATTDVDALAVKRASAEGRVAVDVGFWGGAVPANAGTRGPLHDAGVFGFKCFTAPSGVDEFPHLDPEQLRAAIAEVAELDALLIVHAEDPDLLVPHDALGGRYADFLATRPGSAERSAIARVVDGARETGARVHVLHLSDAAALPLIRAAKADGVRITVETCPHYLAFEAGAIPDGATEFKCCPPIRDDANRDALWAGLLDGTIDCVVSDHSPSTADLKTDDWGLAWGGIAGLQVGFRAVWTEAVRRGIPARDRAALVHDRTGGARRAHGPRSHRAGCRRPPRGPRPRGRGRRRGRRPRAPQPGVRLRGPAHPRSGRGDLAARAARRDGRRGGDRGRGRPARPAAGHATRTKRSFRYHPERNGGTMTQPVNPPARLLMGPGPIDADPRVLRALSTPLVGQYDPWMTATMTATQELYRQVFGTRNDATVLVDGTSRAASRRPWSPSWHPGDRVLVPVFGRFGHLLAEIAGRAGAEVHTIETEWGQVFPTSVVEDAVRRVRRRSWRSCRATPPPR